MYSVLYWCYGKTGPVRLARSTFSAGIDGMTIHGVSNAAPGFELEYAPEPADNTHSVADKVLFFAQMPEDPQPNPQDGLTVIYQSLRARTDLRVELQSNENTGYTAIIDTKTGRPILYSNGVILSLPPGSNILDLLRYIEHLPGEVYQRLHSDLRMPSLLSDLTVLRETGQDFQWLARIGEHIRQTTGRSVVAQFPGEGALRLVLVDLDTAREILVADDTGHIETELSYPELYPYLRPLSEVSYTYLLGRFSSDNIRLPSYLELQRQNFADSIPAMSDAERAQLQNTLANTPTRTQLLGLLPSSLQRVIGSRTVTVSSTLRWAYFDPAAEGYNELRMMMELIRQRYPVYSAEFVLTHLIDFLLVAESPDATPFFLNAGYSQRYAEQMRNVRQEIITAAAQRRPAHLSRWDLSYLDLTRLDLSNANLNHANLTGVIVDGANLAEVQLIGANLTNARLRAAQLPGANLTSATLTNADFSGSNLRGANLVQARASAAVNFNHTDLSQADLSHAILNNSSFVQADLTGAQLVGTSFLKLLNMVEAILSGTDFTDATLPPASRLDGARFDRFAPTNMSGVDLSQALLQNSNFSPEYIITDDNTQLLRSHSRFSEAYTAVQRLNIATDIDELLRVLQQIDSQLLAPDSGARVIFNQRWREFFAQLPAERIGPVLQATYYAYIVQNLAPIFPVNIRIGANTPILLQNLRIPNSQFQNLQTRNVIVQGGDWSGVSLISIHNAPSLINTEFNNVQMPNIHLSISIQNSSFVDSNMQRAQIEQASIEQTAFRSTDLSAATLDAVTISRTSFHRTALNRALFIEVNLDDVTGLETTTGQIRVPVHIASLRLSLLPLDAQLENLICASHTCKPRID